MRIDVTRSQQGPPECTPLDGETLRQMEESIKKALPEDEYLIHFTVLVETRSGPDARKIRVRRFAPQGSDPLLSLGLLAAATSRLRRRLGLGCD